MDGSGARDRDDPQAGAHFAELADDLAAIDPGHAHIGDDQIRLLGAEALQPLRAVHRLDDLMPAVFENLAQHTAIERVVIDEKDQRQGGGLESRSQGSVSLTAEAAASAKIGCRQN